MRTAIIGSQELVMHPAVAHARPWRGYINIDLRSSPSFLMGKPAFKGEVHTRIRLWGTRLTIERSPGATSAEWESNLTSVISWLRDRGVRIYSHKDAKLVPFLATAERHVEEGLAKLQRQGDLIARLRNRSHSTERAEELLRAMQATQDQHVAHRDRLRATIAEE